MKFALRLSKQDLVIKSDNGRIVQVLLSVLMNAAHEARVGSVIYIDILTKPLSEKDIDPDPMTAKNIDVLDFSLFLVYKVNFEHNHEDKIELKDLDLRNVISVEPEETQSLKLALITAQMICKSLFGALKEKESDNLRQYEATFIADGSGYLRRADSANSDRPAYDRLLIVEHPQNKRNSGNL